MNRKQAESAILAILADIPDSQLPKGRVEKRGDKTIFWFGGKGHHLGTATKNGARDPKVHRRSGLMDLLEGEATYRADVQFLKNGDK
jgi:hypothetical protein